MRRKSMVVIFGMVLALALTACGGKDSSDTPVDDSSVVSSEVGSSNSDVSTDSSNESVSDDSNSIDPEMHARVMGFENMLLAVMNVDEAGVVELRVYDGAGNDCGTVYSRVDSEFYTEAHRVIGFSTISGLSFNFGIDRDNFITWHEFVDSKTQEKLGIHESDVLEKFTVYEDGYHTGDFKVNSIIDPVEAEGAYRLVKLIDSNSHPVTFRENADSNGEFLPLSTGYTYTLGFSTTLKDPEDFSSVEAVIDSAEQQGGVPQGKVSQGNFGEGSTSAESSTDESTDENGTVIDTTVNTDVSESTDEFGIAESEVSETGSSDAVTE